MDGWTENVLLQKQLSFTSQGPGFTLQNHCAITLGSNQNYILMVFWCWIKLPTIQTHKGTEWMGGGGNALISIFLSWLRDLLHPSRH